MILYSSEIARRSSEKKEVTVMRAVAWDTKRDNDKTVGPEQRVSDTNPTEF